MDQYKNVVYAMAYATALVLKKDDPEAYANSVVDKLSEVPEPKPAPHEQEAP